MRRILLVGIIGLALAAGLWETVRVGVAQEAASPKADAAKIPPVASFKADILPFLTKNCLSCHSNAKKKGDLSLEKYTDDESLQKDRKVWDNVVQMIRSEEMPPKERPQPTAGERADIMKAIHFVLANVDCTPGQATPRVVLHRLNRAEYNNTIRDLFGLDIKPAIDFPHDETGYGFDNIGEVLTFSDVLVERYMIATETVLDKALPIVKAPKAAKGKLANFKNSAAGAKGAMVTGFVGILKTKAFLSSDAECDEGDYFVRAELAGDQAGDEPVKATLWLGDDLSKEFLVPNTRQKPLKVEWKVRVKTGKYKVYVAFENPYTEPQPEAPMPPAASTDKEPGKEEVNPADNKDDKKAPPAAPPKQRALLVKSVEMDGPYDPPAPPVPEATRKFLSHSPDLKPRDAAKETLTRFATRAYRRPVEPAEVENILKLYDKSAEAGQPFEVGVRWALYRVLLSPHFLTRVEIDPDGAKPGTAYPLNEFNLATRMSYFLWSSMPDEELMQLAAKGELRANLDAQVRRMLKDNKSSAFVENFCGQWLTIRFLATVSPDKKAYPTFDEELRKAMYRETELFFDAMLREDHSVLDFLDADFTFVNERLAKHYGIDGIKGKNFQRVTTPPHRRGILTQASILTLTSNPDRTSPVKRGKWVLDQLLNTPPPPPPDNVPPLEDTQKQLTGTLRQVLEEHRKNAICAGCHQRMDPIGLGLENFDGIGAFRQTEGDAKIDASGTLTDGSTFAGPEELVKLLKNRKDLFTRAFAEKMLTYALGRGLEAQDKCVLDKLQEDWVKDDFRFNSLLVSIVKSDPFQMRVASGGKK